MTDKSLEDIVKETKNKLHEIAEQEKEILKGFLWDLYAEQGMHPHQMRLAFNEVIELIEREEAKYQEDDGNGGS